MRHLPTWGAHLLLSFFFFFFFVFSYCSWGSRGKNTEVVYHSLLQWTMFCQNSPPWPIHLGWPCTACHRASLNYTRQWSIWSFWLASWLWFSFCEIKVLTPSVCPLMDWEWKAFASFITGGTGYWENWKWVNLFTWTLYLLLWVRTIREREYPS